MSGPLIVARRLTKSYVSGGGDVAALGGVDLDIRGGEVTLLVGPSGSGKTTLLSILGGILRPSAGALTIGGHDVSKLGETDLAAIRRQHIGFVFQGYNLFPSLRVWQNIALVLDVKGVRSRRARAESLELLRLVDLEHKRNAFPGELSGGQNQRVAIARALAGRPAIILADEPTAALDSENGRVVMAALRRLAVEHGRAVVVVTHDNRVVEFGDRVVCMEDGRIVDVVEQAANPRPLEPVSVGAGKSADILMLRRRSA
jgi:putative ABC transport system ATP-binding protein